MGGRARVSVFVAWVVLSLLYVAFKYWWVFFVELPGLERLVADFGSQELADVVTDSFNDIVMRFSVFVFLSFVFLFTSFYFFWRKSVADAL